MYFSSLKTTKSTTQKESVWGGGVVRACVRACVKWTEKEGEKQKE